ncbi:hypothetical protein HYDPIDRAFT_31609 [Hydnomerulius pinastri MD-312]|uniref:Protein kinase domain-containing protein n=1 Tax=Hydnomerulius pinastri MD-312 TaxID=994086 RepID=A0A0C9W433_9AGAM|nr:hypothetical protein HYDPIDRAFT_31609 [Hydnomerulius pinastri MD-312]
MKRGFLNTPKAKKAVEEAHQPPAPEPTPVLDPPSPVLSSLAKGKEKATDDQNEDVDGDVQLGSESGSESEPEQDTAAGAYGAYFAMHPWGDPSQTLHRLPPAVQKLYGTKKRVIFRQWPRDPKGKPLLPFAELKGKSTPNGFAWGATLYDFYHVRRLPALPGAIAMMPGSKLAKVMKELGELETAKDELEWAEAEADPREVPVTDMAELVEAYERRANIGMFNLYSTIDAIRESAPKRPRILTVYNQHLAGDSSDEEGGEAGEEGEEAEGVEDDAAANDEGKGKEAEDGPEAPPAEENAAADEDDSMAGDGAYTDPNVALDARWPEPESEDEPEPPVSIPPPPVIPVSSPFHPSHYPPPWPFIPFANPQPPVLLQKRIPLHLLPQTLYVHDPYNLLPARQRKKEDDTPWLSKPDIVRKYTLSLSPAVRKQVEEARKKAEEDEEMKARTLVIMRFARTKEQINNFEPRIEVPLPPYQRRPTKVEEGHLYISPVSKLGTGHHSVVYKAELELPRDLLTEPKLCGICMRNSMREEIQRLKDIGRWHRMMHAVGWGPKGYVGPQPPRSQADIDCLDDVNDPSILEKDGEIVEREITCVVPPHATPNDTLRAIEKVGIWDAFKEKIKECVASPEGQADPSGVKQIANEAIVEFAREGPEPRSTSTPIVSAPLVRINPKFNYQNPCYPETVCPHKQFLGPPPVPRTAKFEVAAKLSIQHDRHLAREAENYQNFPEHFFEHWNGYNLIPPIHDPVPVNALVPQFYGYYKPVKEKAKPKHKSKGEGEGEGDGEDEDDKPAPPPYLSPILLLEHCGTPIDPDSLSIDDQHECTSLLLRFHEAGWLHESFAARNILAQKGSPTETPFMREGSEQLSFRMIDFGRSREYKTSGERMMEEGVALRLFGLHHGAFMR